MSRVYTENILVDVALGTASYIAAFQKSLASTRIDVPNSLGPGTTLLDFFLNVFDTSDPFLPEEVAITAAWSLSDGSQFFGAESGNEFQYGARLHLISPSFKASWPPPQVWVKTVNWGPLSQNAPRHRHFGRYRTRKAGASSGE